MGANLHIECDSCDKRVFNESRSNTYLEKIFEDEEVFYSNEELKDILDNMINVHKPYEHDNQYYDAIYCISAIIMCGKSHYISYD